MPTSYKQHNFTLVGKKNTTQNHNIPRRRRRATFSLKEDKIYLNGVVIESLPSVRFKVRIERPKGLEPLTLECQTKSILKVKKVKIIKGDEVTVELDPQDLSKGLIVGRN